MTMMWIISGLVVGLIVALAVLRAWRRGEKRRSLADKKVSCPNCNLEQSAAEAWKRTALINNKEIFACIKCGYHFRLDV